MEPRSESRLNTYARTQIAAGDSALLLARVCFLTVGCVALTALGALLTWNLRSPGLLILAFLATIGMLFVCQAVARRFPLNLAALAVFALLEGMVFGPALRIYAEVNGGLVIAQAAGLSAVIFGIVGALGYTSAKSYARWIPWLMGGLLLLILAAVVMWFVAVTPMAYLVYCVGGALFFVAFTFVDFTRIRHDYTADDYIPATIAVYLDLINLFWFLLRILGGRRS